MIPKRQFERHFWPAAAVVFALVVAINYFPVFSGRVPFPRDIVMRHSAWHDEPRTGPPQQVGQLIDVIALFYPFRALAGSSVKSGQLPLWNPYIMSGAPFQANAQSALFSPLNLLYYLLPLKTAWSMNLMLRMFLAGMFMTMFAREIGAARTAAIVSGILFALCGFNVEWQSQSNGESCIWLPLLCYSVYRLHRKMDGRSIAIAAFAFAAPVLAGHPETAAHISIVGAALALVLAVHSRWPRFLLAFTVAAVIAIGLAAVQLIPTLEWMSRLDLEVHDVQPGLDRHQGQGFFSRDIFSDPSSALLSIPEGASYVGMLGLLVAPFALFHRSRRDVWFLIGTAILATMIAFGIPPVREIIAHLPVVKAMKNGRFTLVTDFAIAGLAGLGITVLQQQLELQRTRLRYRSLAMLAATFIVLSFGIYEVHRATMTPVGFWRSPWGSLIFLLAAFAVLAGRFSGALNTTAFGILTIAFAAVEMVSYGYGYLGFTPRNEVFPPSPVFEFIKQRSSEPLPFRVAKERVPIPHDAGMIYGFEAADGYDLTTARTRMFTADLIEPRGDGVMFLGEKILAARDRRLDMLNVKYLMVTTPGPQFDMIAAERDRFRLVYSLRSVAIFENSRVLPRALAVPVSGIEVLPDSTAQLARIKETSFDPERSIVFPERPPEAGTAATNTSAAAGHVDVVARRMNEVELRADLQSPSVIVLSQMYYPGWHATIDGAEARVYPVNLALTGVVVPAGAKEIHLVFRPFSFRLGAAVSVVSLVLIGAACLIPRRFRASRHALQQRV